MARFALINTTDNSIIEFRDYATKPNDPAGKPRKWLSCPLVAPPAFDPATERVTGPTYTVGASEVTEAWTKVALTAQEISDAKDAAVNSINGGLYPVLFRAMFNLNNRVRALEGQAALTQAQFKAVLKALI